MSSGEEGKSPALLLIWRVYHTPILLGFLSLLFIALSITIFIKSYQPTTPITFSSDERQATVAGQMIPSTILVDVEGAVIHPGVYTLAEGARVEEALAAAGGFARDADGEAIARSVNRAAKLSDGAKLYIPRAGEAENSSNSPNSLNSLSSLISINIASQSELESLVGIGPVTAGKIISNRPYTRLEELVEKKAMSQSLFEKLNDQLTL